MTRQQVFVALCVILTTHRITAVINSPKSPNLEEVSTKNVTSSTPEGDALPAASEQEAKRRDAPLALSDSYGLPLNGLDTYIPTGLGSNPGLPLPVYGVPSAPSNVVYPAPPPDIPPPLPSPSYGVPFKTYGPPQPVLPPIKNYNPPPLKYGPPIRPAKPFRVPRPRPQYGPPKPIFVPKHPKPIYGPPKPIYGPPKGPLFHPNKHSYNKQPSVTVVTIPNIGKLPESYGLPLEANSGHYGPPDPVPHGPPHPGVPAPPTPPDIKYDGWQPIPGLVSRPPAQHHHHHSDLHLNSDFTPPPADASLTHFTSSSHGDTSYNHVISDSYGAPLNSVTGSGGIVSSSGEELHDDHSLSLGLSAAGIHSQNQLSVVKSISYELFPHGGGLSHIGDSYSSPPLDSYSPNGPYAAAHSHKTHGIADSVIKTQEFHDSGLSISSNGIGLIPPSGVYGVPPTGHYGTPLLSKPSLDYGVPHNGLKLHPPKHPVIFREPVPVGLIESVGQHTAHKDAHGIIEHAHSLSYTGPTYIPPPIPDLSRPVKEEEPPLPSTLYSLPYTSAPLSFQSHVHGSSSAGLGFQNQVLSSYNAPLASIDGSYSLPLETAPAFSVGLDHGHSGGVTVGIEQQPPLTIDLTASTTNLGASLQHVESGHSLAYQPVGHDCRYKTSQPLPSLSYGVPTGLQAPALQYGVPDLTISHSQKIQSSALPNNIDGNFHGKIYGKALAEGFGPETEVIKSESLDINNIPVQGALGSYTLQIQPADSVGQAPPDQVSHGQVLNNGLLQSILAAIEHPQQKDVRILGQPLASLQPNAEIEAQASIPNGVVVSPPGAEGVAPDAKEPSVGLIDNNEIALYFSNNSKNSTDSVRNGQQYGSYVSFKTPNSSYSYESAEVKAPSPEGSD